MPRSISIPDRFCRKVAQTLVAHDMVQPGDAVLVAVSGGPDSMALVRVLTHVAPEFELRIGLAHLNHGLRGMDADRDQAFVQQFADGHGLPCVSEIRDVKRLARETGNSLEEAGRNARYEFFFRTAADHEYTRIATGHTRDDNAEQVLMALVRGSGSKGLSGIPAKRGPMIIRPLIDRSRQEIIDFLAALNQAYITDDSNQDPVFLRNRIRNHLIPLLEKHYNPNIRQGLHRLSRILGEETCFLEDHTCRAFDRCVEKKGPDAVFLSIPGLVALHPALIPRVIRHGILHVKTNLRRITHDHMTAIQDLAADSAPGKHLDLPDRIRVYKTRGRLCIRKETLPLRQLGRMHKQSTRIPPKA